MSRGFYFYKNGTSGRVFHMPTDEPLMQNVEETRDPVEF
jgi:hypothetical protein